MNEQRLIIDQTFSIMRFRRWATLRHVLVIDTETTGLNGCVWDFAAVRVHDLMPVLSFTCNPYAEWEPDALSMAGPEGLELVSISIDARAMYHPLDQMFSRNECVSYGGQFDTCAIRRTWDNLPVPDVQCAMSAYAPLAGQWSDKYQGWGFVSLRSACEREGVPVIDGTHRAFADALMLAALIRAVAKLPTQEEAVSL